MLEHVKNHKVYYFIFFLFVLSTLSKQVSDLRNGVISIQMSAMNIAFTVIALHLCMSFIYWVFAKMLKEFFNLAKDDLK